MESWKLSYIIDISIYTPWNKLSTPGSLNFDITTTEILNFYIIKNLAT
jgi:hypothetical protein